MTRSSNAPAYTLSASTALDPAAAEARLRETLAAEGFGILSEIDIQATLRAKLGEEIESYRILGACSPRDAHLALGMEPELGALLPCNVIVRVQDGVTHVAAADPGVLLGIVGRPELTPIAETIKARLRRALEPVWTAEVGQ